MVKPVRSMAIKNRRVQNNHLDWFDKCFFRLMFLVHGLLSSFVLGYQGRDVEYLPQSFCTTEQYGVMAPFREEHEHDDETGPADQRISQRLQLHPSTGELNLQMIGARAGSHVIDHVRSIMAQGSLRSET